MKRDTETGSRGDTEIDAFAEEVWDCVCRLRVGSGLTTREILKALERVKVLVRLELTTEAGDENGRE